MFQFQTTPFAEGKEEEFRMTFSELTNIADRKQLWRHALKLPEYGRLLDCMRAYVRVSVKADDNTVIEKIAEQVAIVYSQLSEQMHARPSAEDEVSLDAGHLGHRNAHLVSCIADSLFVKYEIINDIYSGNWDDLAEDEKIQRDPSSE